MAGRPRACMRPRAVMSLAMAMVIGPWADQSIAALYTLSDRNSSVKFDTSNPINSYDWRVDGVPHLNTQGFWYRVGNTAEQSLSSLPITFQGATNTNSDPGFDALTIEYAVPAFAVEVKYSLIGAALGSGKSLITENIKIDNTSGGTLDFHFFQYSDFDLLGTPGNDGAVFVDPHAVQQIDGILALAETVLTPSPNRREIAAYPATLNSLNDGLPTTLASSNVGSSIPTLPGNWTWAYQWDLSIPAGGSVTIGKAKRIAFVPEPGSALLLGLGVAGLMAMRARRRAA